MSRSFTGAFGMRLDLVPANPPPHTWRFNTNMEDPTANPGKVFLSKRIARAVIDRSTILAQWPGVYSKVSAPMGFHLLIDTERMTEERQCFMDEEFWHGLIE